MVPFGAQQLNDKTSIVPENRVHEGVPAVYLVPIRLTSCAALLVCCAGCNVPTTVFTPIEYGAVGYSEEDALSKFGEDNVEVNEYFIDLIDFLLFDEQVFHSEFVPLEWSICQSREKVKTMSYCKLIVDKKTVR
jgi:hypothetical protein